MKKGDMHIEIIVSFILFVTFVLFILFYIKPYNNHILPDSVLVGLQSSFEKLASTEITDAFLYATSEGCFGVPLGAVDGNSSVKKLDGTPVNSYLSSGNLYINSSEGYFRVILSQDISAGESFPSCSLLDSSNFSIGSFDSESVISFSKIQQIKERYDSQYDSLKQEMGIPSTFNFAIIVGNVSMERTIYSEAQVLAKTADYRIIYPDGQIKNEEVIFRIW